MYLLHLSRRQLQSRCKQAGIRANTSNKTMAEALERYELAKACASHAKELEVRQEDEEVPTDTNDVHKNNTASNKGNVAPQAAEHVDEETAGSSQEASPGDAGHLSDELSSPLQTVLEHPQDQESPKFHSQSENKEPATEVSNASLFEEEGEADRLVERSAVKCSVENQQESGTLAQELLANEEAPAVSVHREPFKKNVIGQAGKGARLKRAAEKGSLERSTLIAERRHASLVKGGTSEDAGDKIATALLTPGSEQTALLVAGTETGPEIHFEVKERGNEKRENQPSAGEVRVAEIAAPVGEHKEQDSSRHQEERDMQKNETQDTLVEDCFEEDKENALPSTPNEKVTDATSADGEASEEASKTILVEQEIPILLPRDTLVGSLLAAHSGDEKQASSGQPAHRECYKSRPFSAKGVEKRALAAAKKGMGEREAILAERRSLKVFA